MRSIESLALTNVIDYRVQILGVSNAGSFAAIENLLVFLESGVAPSVLKKHMR